MDEQVQRKSSVWPLAAGLVLVVVAAYWLSFRGAFVFDDPGSLIENPTVKKLWPITAPLTPPRGQGVTVEGRPVLNLTFAVNWAISQYDSTFSYHVVNLAIHILAALALFGLVRRTLLLERWSGRFNSCAAELALAVAAVWALHPLQTESVTYIVQRAESLMGTFYLATLYFSLRAFTDPKSRVCSAGGCTPSPAAASVCREEACTPCGWAWTAAAIGACALGMGSKEVMVSAPLVVVLFDRVFLLGSFKEAMRRRWAFYACLASTWAILAYEVSQSATRGGTAGFTGNISPWDYLQTQIVFIPHYLALVFWPARLVLDYGIQLVTGFDRIWPYAIVMVLLLGGSLAAIRYLPWVGFLATLFWMLLAPTSSFVPNVNQIAAEHRMYLPLAPLVALVVIGAYLLYQRWLSGRKVSEDGRWMLERFAPPAAMLALLVTLGTRTWMRNSDYAHEASLWAQVTNYYPENPRGWQNIAYMYSNWAGQWAEMAGKQTDRQRALELRRRSVDAYERAVYNCTQAIQRKPDYAAPYADRASNYSKLNRHEDAIRDFTKAIELDPRLARAYCGRGMLLYAQGRKAEAMRDFEKALEYQPRNELARYNRASMLLEQGDVAAAKRDYEQVLSNNPDHAASLRSLAEILRHQGQLAQALTCVDRSMVLEPDSGLGYVTRAAILTDMNQLPQARQDLEKARRLGQTSKPELEEKLR